MTLPDTELDRLRSLDDVQHVNGSTKYPFQIEGILNNLVGVHREISGYQDSAELPEIAVIAVTRPRGNSEYRAIGQANDFARGYSFSRAHHHAVDHFLIGQGRDFLGRFAFRYNAPRRDF